MAFVRLLLSLNVLLLATHFSGATPVSSRKSTKLQKRDTIPDYALTYAPYSHLYSGESWWPSDIATHVQHVTPEYNYVAVADNVTLEDLNTFNSSIYLTSNDNVEDNPAWLLSAENEPESSGYSAAPATIIAIDKTDYVDVFYFYFYSYNHGNTVLGARYGNHVGDWEHTMVRYANSSPEYIYLSAHDSGTAYNYSALTQTDSRATTYIATGTHANYDNAGSQDYTALGSLLTDTTDDGPYWDVTQNYRGFWYDCDTSTFTSAGGADIGATEQGAEGVGWLSWLGHWGDKQYPDSDSRQDCITDTECHYVDGPTGPLDKNLCRTAVCEDEDDCTIETSI